MHKLYTFLWAGWLGYFVIVEGSAFIMRRTDLTLSEYTWRFEGVGPSAARYLIAVILLWAFFHLTFRLFR